MAVVLKASDISKSYGSIVAVDHVDFEISSSEVVGLVGDNGAGKSTLIKILAGVVIPDGGTIEIQGEGVSFRSPSEARVLGIETVYQDLSLAPDLNVEENIFMGREIIQKGWKRAFGFVDDKAMMSRSQELLDSLHVQIPSLKVPVNTLSGGQRQAVAVVRAAAWGQRLVILDEPTNHLGVEEVEMVLQLIRNIRERGIPVVFVSHTLPHVFEVTDRIDVMRLGHKVASLPTAETNLDEVVSLITGSKEQAA